ncbi:uncharacterized protein LOC114967120 [Acropora millepora]|uniref:uncharacterized protein LOC114967120 n=1 Tax=Acropora millepora TaxID=45264 RepID=UPI001CF4D043|nr:uncharacterized protein LOC114967120 [Acropora millepora]
MYQVELGEEPVCQDETRISTVFLFLRLMIPLEKNTIPVDCDNVEFCLKRLSRKLSTVAVIMADREGRENQTRKERDAERAQNERLKKEVKKLKNALLCERTNSAQKDKKIKALEHEKSGGEDHICDLKKGGRRGSICVASLWRQSAGSSWQNHPKYLAELLDKRTNELLQQRQQNRIFEKRCNKLDGDIERVHHLLIDLVCLHKKHLASASELKCNRILGVGKSMNNNCTNKFLLSVSLVLFTLFVFLIIKEHFQFKEFISRF